jgi:hypothetical protein
VANTNDPRGFKIWLGDGKAAHSRRYAKTAAIIYEGDLVERTAAGTLQTATAGSSNRIVGVAVRYATAADGYIDVYDDPDATFTAQSDGTSAYAVADNGLNADIAAGTPDTALDRSGQVVDIATKAVTATLPVKILGLAAGVNGGENGAGVNALLLVKLNHVERGAGVAGI